MLLHNHTRSCLNASAMLLLALTLLFLYLPGQSARALPFTIITSGSPATPPPAGDSPPTFDMQPPSLSIGDASVFEGDSGTAALSFSVSLSATSGQTVTVDYATQNGATSPASAPDDYAAITTTELSFPPGTIVQTITVQVNGDIIAEQNETLFVDLSGAASATIADTQGQGKITNDDGSVLSIDDVSLVEGNSGTSNLFFNVSISKLNAGW
jgi:hypothetical protein